MSKTIHYFCDQCKKEVKEHTVLTDVKIVLNPYSSYNGTKFEKTSNYFEICEECTEKLGFTLRKIVDTKLVVEPTTADKLYDLIAQMIIENSH